ncbi:helix-turn-helix transcriptional regulator [Thiotrichales bacterium 19S3-7]|nr:helix-turn-helix transcriptional regulator [Thiotrichales bacterium 19S3-7]MCF6803073.1 helix-turn-helix transcriptional regulator [Thiotrichales bacterium 19S3-11]
MAINSIDLHLSAQNSEVIIKATELLKLIGVDFFLYYVRYDNGSELKCSNRSDWINYYTKHKLYKDSIIYTTKWEKIKSNSFYLFDYFEAKKINELRSAEFNIDHIIAWINSNNNYLEMFQFGVEADQCHRMNYYINHLKLLRRFITYFKNELIPNLNLEKEKLLITPYLIQENALYPLGNTNENLDQFLHQTKIKLFNLEGQYNNVSLTSRELDCLYELAKGLMIKEIAKNLSISPRTVETHLNHIKNKLTLTSKSDLICFARNHLDDFL